jgi:DNA-binding transcriptional regulator YdaS (Cro superfamily)
MGQHPDMTLDEIIELAGGVTKLAELANVDHSTISSGWRRTGKIPVERALLIHDKLAVPLHEIRPDIWRPAITAADPPRESEPGQGCAA